MGCGVWHDALMDTRLSVFESFGIYLYFQKQMGDFGYLQFFLLIWIYDVLCLSIFMPLRHDTQAYLTYEL